MKEMEMCFNNFYTKMASEVFLDHLTMITKICQSYCEIIHKQRFYRRIFNILVFLPKFRQSSSRYHWQHLHFCLPPFNLYAASNIYFYFNKYHTKTFGMVHNVYALDFRNCKFLSYSTKTLKKDICIPMSSFIGISFIEYS